MAQLGQLGIGVNLDLSKFEGNVTGLKRSMKVVDSVMNASMRSFKGVEDSSKKLGTQLEGLEKKQEAQIKIVEEQRKKYDELSKSKGEYDRQTQLAGIQLGKAIQDLEKYEDSISKVQDELSTVDIDVDITGLKNSMRVAESELKLTKSGFLGAEESAESLGAELEGLKKTFEIQSKTVEEHSKRYEALVEAKGENSKEAQDALVDLNREKVAMNELGHEITKVEGNLRDLEEENSRMASGMGRNNEKLSLSFVALGSVVRDLDSEMKKTFTSMEESINKVSDGLVSFGDGVAGVGKGLTKHITLPALGAATAVGGVTAALGWGRLKNKDSAKAKLKGLGFEDEDVERITEQVTTAISGGITTMDEGISISAGALAAGVKEGEELERFIKLVGDAAVGAGRPVESMASIFNRVQGMGKLMTQELNMVEDGMPGFAQAMADSMGVTQEEFRKMVTAGEVSSEQFLNVMEGFAGSMAEEYAKSWDGMVSNTKARIGIIGENLLGGVFEQSKDALREFSELLKSEDIVEWSKQVGEAIDEAFTKVIEVVKEAVKWFTDLDSETQKMYVTFGAIGVVLGPLLVALGGFIGIVGKALKPLAGLFGLLGKKGILGALGFLGKRFLFILGPLGLLAGGFLLFKDTLESIGFDGVLGKFKDFFKAITGLYKGDDENNGPAELLYSLGFSEEMVGNLDNIIQKVKTVVEGGMKLIRSLISGDEQGTEDALSSLGFTPEMQKKLGELFRTVGETLKEIAGIIAENVVPMVEEGVKKISEFYDKLAEFWSENGEDIITTVTKITEIIGYVIKVAIPLLFGILKAVFKKAEDFSNTVFDVLETIVKVITGIFTFDLDGAVKKVGEFFTGIWDSITGFFGGFKKDTEDEIGDLESTAEGAASALGKLGDNPFGELKEKVTESLSGVGESIKGFFGDVWSSVTEEFEKVKQPLEDVATKIWETVTGVFTGIWETLSGEVTGAMEKIGEFLQPIIEMFKTFYDSTIGLVAEAVYKVISSIIQFVLAIVKKIAEEFVRITTEVGVFLYEIVQKIYNFFTGIIESIVGYISEISKVVFGFFAEVIKKVWSFITDIIAKLVGFGISIWTKVTEISSMIITILVGLVQSVWDRFKEMRDKVVSVVTNIALKLWEKFTEIRDSVMEIITPFLNNIRDKFDWVRDRVVGAVTGLYDGVKEKFTNVKNKVTEIIDEMKESVTGKFDDIVDGAKKLPERIGDGIKKGVSFITDALKSMGNSMAEMLGKVVNGLIGGMNGVLDKLGIDDKITEWDIPKYSKGTKRGGHAGGLMTVGDRGPGNSAVGKTRELVQYPNGLVQLFEKETTLNAPKGTQVLSNRDTEKMLKIPEYSTGTKGAGGLVSRAAGIVQSAKDKVTGAISNIWDAIQNPGKLVNKIIETIGYKLEGMKKFPTDLAKGVFGKVKDGAKKFITGAGEKATPESNLGALLAGHKINWAYGKYPFAFNGGNHYGIDTDHVYDPVRAAIGGKVRRYFFDTYGGGNTLEIQSGKIFQWYAHLSKSLVKAGDTIKAGQKIAVSGNTGTNSTGPHLHYQLFRNLSNPNGSSFDPVPYLRGKGKGGAGGGAFDYFTGGIINDEGFYRLAEKGSELVVPTDDKTAMVKMLHYLNDLIGNDGSGNTRTSQIPTPKSSGGNGDDSLMREQNEMLREMISMMKEARNRDREDLELARRRNEVLEGVLEKDFGVVLDGRKVSKQLYPHIKKESDRDSNKDWRLGRA